MVACLVFEHIDEIDEAVAEVGRVLGPGGRFLLLLNHPLLQTPSSGWIDDTILEEQYWRIGPYLVEDTRPEEVEKDVWIPFIHRPLSRYINAMVDAGMFVTRMEEPAPPPDSWAGRRSTGMRPPSHVCWSSGRRSCGSRLPASLRAARWTANNLIRPELVATRIGGKRRPMETVSKSGDGVSRGNAQPEPPAGQPADGTTAST